MVNVILMSDSLLSVLTCCFLSPPSVPVVASQDHKDIESSEVFTDILRKCIFHFYKHQCSSEEDKERFLRCFDGLAHLPVHRIVMRSCQ